MNADRDPFEEFNHHQGMGAVRDPYPGWAALREQAPVQRLDLGEIFGKNKPLPPGMGPEIHMALSFDAVVDALRDPETFSSQGYARSIGLVMGHTILEMDPPEHGRSRGLLQKAFSRKALARWEHQLVRPVIAARLAHIRGRGRADLVREVTFPFPVEVIAGMIGLPEEEHSAFHRLAVELISIAFDPARGLAAAQALGEMFARHLARRRADPDDDLLSVLAHAELDGEALEDEAIFAFLRLLAPAGAETTYRSTSNLLFGLLSHPEQLDAVRRNPRLLSAATEEALRWECPLTGILRTTTRETQLCGVAIPAEASVHLNLAAANRDPARWPSPDAFDLFRTPRPHAAFAYGPHTCLGMHLARMETRVLLELLFEALPGLRLDPEAEDVHITGKTFRSPLALPVLFDA